MKDLLNEIGDRCRKKLNTTRTLLVVWLILLIFNSNINADTRTSTEINEARVINLVKNVEKYIKENGKEKAITNFKKNKTNIFIANYDGVFFVSPLHPELIGNNQFNYRDASGTLVVQEEINKAKAGGGWLKGRWRQNPLTGNFECRKIYIRPIPGNYFIGSWYHYVPDKPGICSY